MAEDTQDTEKQYPSSNESRPQPWLEPHRYKSGQSGNPGGRPKGRSLTARLREVLERDDAKIAQMIVEALAELATGRDLNAIREVFDRVEGKPKPIQPEGPAAEARDAWEEACDETEDPQDPGKPA